MTHSHRSAAPSAIAPSAFEAAGQVRPALPFGRIAALLVSTALIAPAHAAAPAVFSPAWFSARTAGRAAATTGAAIAARAGASLAQVQQSISNLQRAAQAIAAAGAAQAAARAVAFTLPTSVPDGLAPGGLQPVPGVSPGDPLWQGANLPTQSGAVQRPTVTVQQTTRQAVLTWQTFNVGRHTTLAFDQSAGGGAAGTWVALNRVADPQVQPSQILGAITAPGQVYVINRNGVIFGATSQVDTGALIASAADINSGSFLTRGIYSPNVATPSFTGAAGAITVQAGAQIATAAPASANAGGGFVLLLGTKVENAGVISTPSGQTALAAGRDFVLVPGFGSSVNADPAATVQGNEVAVAAGAGDAANTGLIQASDGDITLVGHKVTQGGVIAASTGLGQRGTVHLLTDFSAADPTASVTLAPGSTTAITIDASSTTALEALRAIPPTAPPTTTEINDFAGLADVRDLSRVEITSGGSVGFGAGSLTLASSGQIAVAAKGTVLMDPGAAADVAGLVGVTLPQSANVFQASIEPYNLRDSPVNRDTGLLNSRSVSIDARTLVYVPAANGTPARYYTGGGLLEVGGELGNVGHTIAEYSTNGGTVEISAPTVIAQPGSAINLAGGSIQYRAGPVPQTWLLGADGRIYNLNSAPDSVVYTGVFNGFTEAHPHWGVTQTFVNPLIAPASIEQAGYTVGHDAGSLLIAAPTTLFGGAIQAGTAVGAQQDKLPVGGQTGLLVTQSVVPRGGTLDLANFNVVAAALGLPTQVVFQPGSSDVLIADAAPATGSLTTHSRLTDRQSDTTAFSARMLDASGLGSILVETDRRIAVTGALSVADGGSIDLVAPMVSVAAPLVARAGAISLGETQAGTAAVAASVQHVGVSITASAAIDTRGVWTNALQQPGAIGTEAWINGGAVTVESQGSIALAAGSAIDASAGGYVSASGAITGGAGGNIALIADAAPANSVVPVNPGPSRTSSLTLGGTVRSVGYTHGGTLTLQAAGIAIGDGLAPSYAGELVLPPALFATGFSNYTISGATNVRVAPGAQLAVVEPVYEATALSATAPSGSDPDAVFQVVLPPLYSPNPVQARLTQRVGAGLTLDAPGETPVQIGPTTIDGNPIAILKGPAHPYGKIELGAGGVVSVDPGQAVALVATLSAAIDGSIFAPGGTIEVVAADPVTTNQALGDAAVSVGATARLDVAGAAATALDTAGRPYGVVQAGGTIVLGNVPGSLSSGQRNATDAFVLIHPGAVLDASGSTAAVALNAGQSPGVSTAAGMVQNDTAGGLIYLASYTGIVADGTLRAAAGGASAAGGTLDVVLENGVYSIAANTSPLEDPYLVPRRIVVSQSAPARAADASDAALEGSGVGVASLSADAIQAGGFGSLTLFARDAIDFRGNVDLALQQAITLQSGGLAETSTHGHVVVSAPYVLLSGVPPVSTTSGIAPEVAIPAALRSASTLRIDASLIDLQNAVLIGVTSDPTLLLSSGSTAPVVVAPGFGTLDLTSAGDIRFLGGSSATSYRQAAGNVVLGGAGSVQSSLVSYGDVSFNAAQVYPVTGAIAEVDVGAFAATLTDQNRTAVYSDNTSAVLAFSRAGGADVAPPSSLFGILSVTAPTIEQGGVLRAPFGAVDLGASVSTGTFTTVGPAKVDLLPGSVTSVSAAGQSIPYGGTSDGITYNAAGLPVSFSYATNAASNAGSNVRYGIAVAGQAIAVDAGATLDLQGGGTITGAAFLAGRGGSADTLLAPLLSVANHAVSAPTLGASDAVYALLPGAGYAPPMQPDATSAGGSLPGIGETVTLATGVAGLPAGTYTLLPSYYALQPGGYRVELRASQPAPLSGPLAQPNGSVVAAVALGVANTAVRAAIPVSAIITPGATVRRYAQYDEESYSAFATSQPSVAVFGTPRPVLPQDAGELDLAFGTNLLRRPAFVNAGTELLGAAPGGLGGTLAVYAANTAEPLVIGTAHTDAPGAIVVDAAALNAVNPATMIVGGVEAVSAINAPPQSIEIDSFNSGLTLASGASLTAPQVLLASNGTVVFETRSTIDTIGRSGSFLDSSSGLHFAPQSGNLGESVVAVSNGNLLFDATQSAARPGSGISVAGAATLYTGGTLAFETAKAIAISPSAQLGASSVAAEATAINIGDASSLRPGLAPPGLLLTQQLLDTLLAGNPAAGVPAMQQLDLTASQSVNFFGSTQLNGAGLRLFVLNTPGIYGAGSVDDTAVLNVGTLYWNGQSIRSAPDSLGNVSITLSQPPLVTAGGPGSGLGTLDINAQQIVFGFGPNDVPQAITPEPRAIFGFGEVNLVATQQITAANLGTLLVYQSQGALQTDGTLSGSGGALHIATPLLTAAANGTLDITAGGAVTLSPGPTAAASAAIPNAAGGEIGITAASIDDATAIVLPSGRAILAAQSDITLEAGARLDVSGQNHAIVDQTVGGPGGTAILSSAAGGIAELPGASIAFGGAGNQAGGSLSATASQGAVALDGALAGGGVDAADSGGFTLDASALPSFATLNQALTAGGVFGARRFEIGTGDLTIQTTDQLRARTIGVSLDAGSLTVDGLVDAGGARVGTISLAGQTGLTLTGHAVLAAQGSALVADSYGQAIDASNRAEVSLTAAGGTLTLAPGATLALGAADGIARGDLELNAARATAIGGSIAVSAPGSLAITGAATIALNGFWSYHPTGGIVVQSNLAGGTVLDAGAIGLDQIAADSTAFDTAALASATLHRATAGLASYGAAFHLRPGVIVDSSGTGTGNLSVDGDLDLSAFRYGPNAQGNGSGEPGVLILRAAGNLGVYGSISDGFQPPPATPDQSGWVLNGRGTGPTTTVLTHVTLGVGTTFNNDDLPLDFPVKLAAGAAIRAGVAVPAAVSVTLDAAVQLTQSWTATGTVTTSAGSIQAGQPLTRGERLPKGTVLGPGSTLPQDYAIAKVTWPSGDSLGVFSGPVTLDAPVVVKSGQAIPGDAQLKLGKGTRYVDTRAAHGRAKVQGSVDALAPMLAAGDLSWSIGLVAGANLAAGDPYAVSTAPPVTAGGAGNLLLDDPHYGSPVASGRIGPQGFSVVRTGTGALTLAAGGSIDQQSPFGIYTAGTQSATTAPAGQAAPIDARGLLGSKPYQAVLAQQLALGYQRYFPVDGGNLSVDAAGSITAYNFDAGAPGPLNSSFANQTTGWLWEQGSSTQPAAWWINFGSYIELDAGASKREPAIAGFAGLGTLGGGNVVVRAGGNVGATTDPRVSRSDGIDIAVGATGQVTSVQQVGTVVTGGALLQSGGGDLLVQIGGSLETTSSIANGGFSDVSTITDIRGSVAVTAGSVGFVQPVYGNVAADPRFSTDVLTAETANAGNGVTLAIGDGVAAITTRGDLSLSDALDPGRQNNNFFFAGGSTNGTPNVAISGFSLWQPRSGIALDSAGGVISANSNASVASSGVGTPENLDEYPPQLAAVAPFGSIYFFQGTTLFPVELAPSAGGSLSLLAGQSVYGPAVLTMSGAPAGMNDLPNPFKPVHEVLAGQARVGQQTNATNGVLNVGGNVTTSLFAFEQDTPTGPLQPAGGQPIRVYAGSGDIVGLNVGQEGAATGYQGSIATSVIAGRDIVDFGQPLSLVAGSVSSPSLFVNDYTSDVSVLQAGRDIIYANADVAGPGLLFVQAGRDLYQANQGTMTSLGQQVVNAAIPPSDSSGGASITALVGTGAAGPAWTAFADLYFNDASQANPSLLLSDPANAGKVQQTYGAALLAWLQQNAGYAGDQAGALAAFLALPVPRQSEFLLPVYFDELRLSGRQFTDPASRFAGSYARGRQAIATLFPAPPSYQGSVTMFGLPAPNASTPATASAITTNFGGDITLLAPGGQVSLGTTRPGILPATYGVITFGQGNVDIYSLGSVLLGTSRVFTTFGGGITIWSAQGDINAGAGTKSAVVAQPFSLNYDLLGDVTLSPQAPSTGAGIATLSEIPGTVAGDVDLVAPQGTIDAGEAGIRSSGNANLAALAIANGANLQVSGKTSGTPVVSTPNIGALNAAASVGAAAQNTGQQAAARQQASTSAGSIITVEVLGFGG